MICLCTLFTLFACSATSGGYTRLNAVAESTFSLEHLQNETYDSAYRDFSYRFFRTVATTEKENLCISPLSAYMAFSLCFYGSNGITAEEFSATFGLTKEQAAEYCESLYASFMQRQYRDEKTRVNLANSVWLDERVTSYVKEEYLRGATDHFNAPIFKCDFSDQRTLDYVNDWCADNTDGLIRKIIDRFDDNQIMALINALLVEASWIEQYLPSSIVSDTFRNAEGTDANADYLCRKITSCYLSSDAKAFRMPLRDGFSFVGILPDQGISITDYCATLTAEKIASLLAKPSYDYDVYTRIPEFSADFELDLRATMQSMGMTSAFRAETADFTSMTSIPHVYVGTAKQKTHFELDKNGIKAAAVTYIAINEKSVMPIDRPKINIYLDRPFIYLLVENETNLPLFIGRINNLGE